MLQELNGYGLLADAEAELGTLKRRHAHSVTPFGFTRAIRRQSSSGGVTGVPEASATARQSRDRKIYYIRWGRTITILEGTVLVVRCRYGTFGPGIGRVVRVSVNYEYTNDSAITVFV